MLMQATFPLTPPKASSATRQDPQLTAEHDHAEAAGLTLVASFALRPCAQWFGDGAPLDHERAEQEHQDIVP